jgi:hypothetical protein
MEGRFYAIDYEWQVIDKADAKQEGLHYMEITLLNVDSIEIGKRIHVD